MMSDSDSDDSSMDLNIDEKDMEQIMELESSLEKQPEQYDVHVKYVSLLRRCGMKERLRDARHAMHELFPMSESMWLEWIHDEMERANEKEDLDKIEELFEKSHHDYLSVELWCQHIEFLRNFRLQDKNGDSASIQFIRGVIEMALDACGLHMAEGHKIWNAAIDFESSLPNPESNRLESLYLRYLDTPFPPQVLEGVLDGYIALKRSEEGPTPPKAIQKKFQRSQRAYEIRQMYEDALGEAREVDSTKSLLLVAYQKYIDLEISSEDHNRVQIIYERALSEFPVAHNVWKDYVAYFECVEGRHVETLYTRALRNCPWVGDLWASYLLHTLRTGGDNKDYLLSKIFEDGKRYVSQSPDDMRTLVLARATTLRLMGTFEQACRLLKETVDWCLQVRSYVDPEHALVSLWACCEVGQDFQHAVERAEKAWNHVLGVSFPDSMYASTWIMYIENLSRLGAGIEKKREIFQRAIDSEMPVEEMVHIARAWVQMERQEGNTDSFFQAQKRTNKIFKDFTTRNQEHEIAQHQQEKAVQVAKAQRQANDPNFGKRKRETGTETQQQKKKKSSKTNGNQAAKQHDNVDMSKSGLLVFVKHIVPSATEEDLMEEFSECGTDLDITIGRDPKSNRSKGYAYIRCSSTETRDKLLQCNGREYQGKHLFIAISNPPKSHQKDEMRAPAKEIIKKEKTTQHYSTQNERPTRRQKIGTAMLVPRSTALATSSGTSSKPKTNEDFRALLLSKSTNTTNNDV